MEIEAAVPFDSANRFTDWMAANHAMERELRAAIFKKSSGKQTVRFDAHLDVALCWGWVDVKTKGIDTEHYGIRFVPRKSRNNWSATNRVIVCQLIAYGQTQLSGEAVLPADLVCP
jgi:uncharacterized protein YdeI (YjbR/CyaY-like superfamily)